MIRAPLLHFLVLGSVLYGASRIGRDEAPVVVIRLATADVEQLEADWLLQTGRAPTAHERTRMIEARFDEELLLAEAYALGWHRSDAIAQRRLLQNQRFLEPESQDSDALLLERAYAQGMDRSDIVVRRRLVERMKLTIASAARHPEPDEDELARYLARHPETFRRPAQIRLHHVYLSRDQRGASLANDAVALGERLRNEAIAPDRALELGDPFLLSSALPLSDEAALGRQLGPDFAAAVFALPLQRWSGPIASSYGLHWVWLHERVEAHLPALEQIRGAVRAELLREREQRALRAYLARLRTRARLEVGDVGERSPPAAGGG